MPHDDCWHGIRCIHPRVPATIVRAGGTMVCNGAPHTRSWFQQAVASPIPPNSENEFSVSSCQRTARGPCFDDCLFAPDPARACMLCRGRMRGALSTRSCSHPSRSTATVATLSTRIRATTTPSIFLTTSRSARSSCCNHASPSTITSTLAHSRWATTASG